MNDKHSHKHSHDHGHGHDHHHGPGGHHHGPPPGSSTTSFAIAFSANFIFAIVELVGGFWTGSLAIMADAVHDFGDALSIAIAWGLERFAQKKSDQSFNFGYRRFSLLAALLSGLIIAGGAVAIGYHAVLRFSEPRAPMALGMLALAILGIAVNGGAFLAIRKGVTQNERVLSWHLIEDLLGWVAVLAGAVVIYITGWTWVDPLLAIGLSIFIFWNVAKNLRETIFLLLQGRPPAFVEAAFQKEVLAVDGVGGVDRIQVWSLDGASSVLSARVHLHSIDDRSRIEAIKERVRHIALHHGATQATIETCLINHECTDSPSGS